MLCSGSQFSTSLCYVQVTSLFTQGAVLVILSSLNILFCCFRAKYGGSKSPAKSTQHHPLTNRIKGHSVRWILTIIATILLILKLAESVFSAVMFQLRTAQLVYLFVSDDLLNLLVFLCIALTYTHLVEIRSKYKLLWILWLYWLASVIFRLSSAILLYTVESSRHSANFFFTVLLLILYFSFFILDSYLNFSKCLNASSSAKLHVTSKDKKEGIVYRYPFVILPSQITWHWLNGLLVKGYKKPLEIEDLGVLPQDETTKKNFETFRHFFEKEMVSAKSKGGKPSLWKCYFHSGWRLLIVSGICKIFYDMAVFVPPICLDKIVDYVVEFRENQQLEMNGNGTNVTSSGNITLENHEYFAPLHQFVTNGFVLSLFMLMSAIIQGFAMQLYLYLSAKNGIRVKGALQAMVYHKTLHIPSKSLTDGQMSQGQVLNHMSVDAINIFMLLNLGHLTWGIPLQVTIGCLLLYHQLGYTTLISTGIILLSCPIQYVMGNKLASLQKQALDLADERIKKSNETLQSMKLLKLYAWELLFTKSILDTRHKEVIVYLKAGLCRVITILITDGTPIIACVVTFTMYPYLEQKPLTPGKVFSSYAILMIISLCLFLTPYIINVWSHAVVSTRRLHRFLTTEEVKPSSRTHAHTQEDTPGNGIKVTDSAVVYKNDTHTNDKNEGKDPLLHSNLQMEDTLSPNHQLPETASTEEKCALSHSNAQLDEAGPKPANQELDDETVVRITNGSFSWDSKEENNLVLEDINLSIQKGKLTMVVGPVGTGKSSLLSALLGEMVQQAGSVTWNSNTSVAYGAQKAWLLNASLRENILFGKPFQSQWYSRVVKACALQPDIDMLIGGDQTEIGEKGINVSGGQKQRISLGRAMYSGTSVLLLDDPFSALDAHVGGQIFKEGIQKLLLEQQKTIVLVTHQLHYLPFADEIIAMKDGKIIAKGTYNTLLETNPEIFKIIEQENLQEEEEHSKDSKILPRPMLRLHIPSTLQNKDIGSSSPKLSPHVPHNVYLQNSTTPPLSPDLVHAKIPKVEQTKSQTDVRHTSRSPKENPSLLRLRSLNSKSHEHLPEDSKNKGGKSPTKPRSPEGLEEMGSFLATSRLASSLTSLTYGPAPENNLRKIVLKEQISKEDTTLVQKGQLIEEEERETGSVSLKVCWKYTKAASLALVSLSLIGYILRQAARMGTDIWLADWSEAGIRAEALLQHANYTNLTLNDTYDLEYYIRGYLIWQGVSFVFLLLGIVALECMTLNASRNLHRQMVKAVIKAPMRFFDTTPIGRIINRMSGDTNKLDEHMPVTVDNVLFCALYVLGGLVLNAIFIPIFIIPVLLMLVIYILVQRFYITSSREMQRLDSITKSPILAHFSETLGGLPTIRAYNHQWRFQEQNWKNVDTNNTAFLFLHTTNGWMGVRLECIGAFITFFSGVMTICWGIQGYINPSIVGVAIAYATTTSSFLNWFMKNFSELEMWLNAAERITHYTEIKPEVNSPNSSAPADWPQCGDIQFSGVSLRYDSSLDPVVRKLDLHIKAGEKVGICGRTGSGKSSLTLSIFNMIDICEGQVLIDGVDIKTVSLHDLRSRLAIIPQDPVLFSGTVRYNLDPENEYKDESIWQSLEIAQLKPIIQSLPGQLDAKVDESGDNFSVGQRQLFCLARAFLRNAKILVMDEPTASVDMATDAVIQEITQVAFKDKTIITIAHRVATIVNYDTIVVLNAGKIIEKGSPSELMQMKSGSFATMLKHNQ